jgi:hypothetical protein
MRRLLTVVLGWWIASIMIIYEHMFYRNQIAAKRLKKIRTTVSEFTAAMQPAYGKTGACSLCSLHRGSDGSAADCNKIVNIKFA